MSTFTLTIDSQTVEAQKGDTVLQAAQRAGIHIPVLCYHPALSPEEACRVCVVEQVRGTWSTLVAACVYPASPDMVIKTDSEMVADARRTIVELILSDHPNECMICNASGRCELQDLAYELGVNGTPFAGQSHEYPIDPDPSPYVHWDMNKCVLCRRCVKACADIQGAYVLAKIDRAFESTISTAFGDTLEAAGCENCGQCITFCPVDAISDKPARGRWRNWHLEPVATTCLRCPSGCRMVINVADNQVAKVAADFGSPANHGALCYRGRFNLDKFVTGNRLAVPLVKEKAHHAEVDYPDALAAAKKILSAEGPMAVLAGGELTNEEGFLLGRLIQEALGGAACDFAGRLPPTGSALDEIDAAGSVLAVGANPMTAAPMLTLAVRRAGRLGRPVIVAGNPEKHPLTRAASTLWNVAPENTADLLGGLLRVFIDEGLTDASAEGLSEAATYASRAGVPLEDLTASAKTLAQSAPFALVVSLAGLETGPGRAITEAATRLRAATGGPFYLAGGAANSTGLGDVGLAPSEGQPDFDALIADLKAGAFKRLLVVGLDLAAHLGGDEETARVLDRMDGVVVLAAKESAATRDADVVLPLTTFVETCGTVTNLEGRVCRIRDALTPFAESRPGWMVLRDLLVALGRTADYQTPSDVFLDLARKVPAYQGLAYDQLEPAGVLLKQG
ncbi:MAG: molybdopterin-dependent oxidoreductase [Proteobacteria bacterium]|nr:molybdopterin-dependent oxidoreductase [Pseudomonadota bacterium]